MTARPKLELFLEKIAIQDDGCWLWTGATITAGYGVHTAEERLVHRMAYRYFVGPIPDGLVIDHLCHNADKACKGGKSCPHRRCVNPDHLEAVTQGENLRRGRPGEPQHRTHCPHGHLYDEANTYVDSKGSKFCRACPRERYQLRRAG